jgi:hypothetical protein
MKKLFSTFLLGLIISTVCFGQGSGQISADVTGNSSDMFFSHFGKYVFYPAEGLLIIILISSWIYHVVTAGSRTKAELKANVEKIRNEEIDTVPAKGLNKLRSSLLAKVKKIDKNENVNTAKKLEIATGEVDLAVKLKSIIKSE